MSSHSDERGDVRPVHRERRRVLRDSFDGERPTIGFIVLLSLSVLELKMFILIQMSIKLIILIIIVLAIVYGVFAYVMGLTIDDIKAGNFFSKPSNGTPVVMVEVESEEN